MIEYWKELSSVKDNLWKSNSDSQWYWYSPREHKWITYPRNRMKLWISWANIDKKSSTTYFKMITKEEAFLELI